MTEEFTLLEYGRPDKTVHAAEYNTAWVYLLVGGQPGLDIQSRSERENVTGYPANRALR